MEIEEDIINKLLDKILTKDSDFVKVLDCFLLDRLEQYSDDPEILFGIKKIKDLIPTIENLIPDRYISIFNKEILLKKHKPKVSKSLGDWNIHIQINYSSEDDLKDLMKLLVNYKVIDEKTNKIINCNCEVKQFIKAIKHKPVI